MIMIHPGWIIEDRQALMGAVNVCLLVTRLLAKLAA